MTNPNDLMHSFNHTPDTEGNLKGLTKREYFAAMAIQGILSGNEINRTGRRTSDSIAEFAVHIADALIKALNEQ